MSRGVFDYMMSGRVCFIPERIFRNETRKIYDAVNGETSLVEYFESNDLFDFKDKRIIAYFEDGEIIGYRVFLNVKDDNKPLVIIDSLFQSFEMLGKKSNYEVTLPLYGSDEVLNEFFDKIVK